MEMSLLTHGDPLAGDACVLWCLAIDDAIATGRSRTWPPASSVSIPAGATPGRTRSPAGVSPRIIHATGSSSPPCRLRGPSCHPGDLAHPARHLEAALRTAVTSETTPTPWPPSPVACSGRRGLGGPPVVAAGAPRMARIPGRRPGAAALMATGRSGAPGDLPADLSDGPA